MRGAASTRTLVRAGAGLLCLVGLVVLHSAFNRDRGGGAFSQRHLLSSLSSDSASTSDGGGGFDCAAESDSSSLLDYAAFHYCTMVPLGLGWLSLVVQIVFMLFLFICLGVAAESFFCPALNVISEALKLSENVAGVTFLALGNGAPDVFSSFAAVSSGSFDLGVGGVLGAAVFITTVCVGSVAIIAPFTVTRRPFLRDVVMFILSLVFILVVLIDGVVVLWEACFLVSYYILYVVVVVAARSINQRLKAANPAKYSNPDVSFKGLLACVCDGGDEREPLLPPAVPIQQASIQQASAVDEAPAIVVEDVDDKAPHAVNLPKSVTAAIDFLQVARNERSGGRERSGSQLSSSSINKMAGIARSKVSLEPVSPWLQMVQLLLPTVQGFMDKTLLGKVNALLNLPVMFVLTLSVPLVIPEKDVKDEDDELAFPDGKRDADHLIIQGSIQTSITSTQPEDDGDDVPWNRPLFALQCFTAPVFLLCLAFGQAMTAIGSPKFLGWALSLVIGFVFAVVAWFTSVYERPPKYAVFVSILTFLVSVMWIYMFASELIGIIETLGAIMGIDPTLLGITVLAWGNSVGDFVSNLTVAKMGFPNMAVSASFGGPMLNMLLGVGISSGYAIILTGQDFPAPFDIHLFIVLGSLFVILTFLIVYIPVNHFKGDRKLGIILLLLFTLSTGINIGAVFF